MDTIDSSFSKSLIPHISDLFDIALIHLQALLPAFIHYYTNPLAPSPPQSPEDESTDLSRISSPIFDFLSGVARSGKAKAWLQQNDKFNALVEAIVNWIQMTNEDVSMWDLLTFKTCTYFDIGGDMGD